MIARFRSAPQTAPDRIHREESEVPQRANQGPGDQLAADWDRIAAELRASLDPSSYELWFAELRPLSARGPTLYLTGPAAKLSWVQRRFPEVIDFALRASASDYREIAFVAAEAGRGTPSTHEEAHSPDPELGVLLNPAYSFDRFVIGAGNRLAHGAALAVAEAPSQAYNPLFLHGAPGLGKTHLLGAIANYLSLHSPTLAVHYTTAERFTNEFVLALQSRGVERFKRHYRRAEVLLIDDVQFLEGKSRTADEFFHTFNALYEGGAQIVLSADRLPRELSALAERLRHRFQWGLTVELEPPDHSTRLAFLDRLLLERQDNVDPQLRDTLVSRASDNLGLLEAALTRITALASLTGAPVDLELLDRALPRSFASRRTTDDERAAEIRRLVSERLQIDAEALLSSTRTPTISRARQLAMHLTRELTDLSLPQIARHFGRRDHTTVLYAQRQVRRRSEADPAYRQLILELTDAIADSPKDRDRTD
jgi:chromosomal replication initiator protein